MIETLKKDIAAIGEEITKTENNIVTAQDRVKYLRGALDALRGTLTVMERALQEDSDGGQDSELECGAAQEEPAASACACADATGCSGECSSEAD